MIEDTPCISMSHTYDCHSNPCPSLGLLSPSPSTRPLSCVHLTSQPHPTDRPAFILAILYISCYVDEPRVAHAVLCCNAMIHNSHTHTHTHTNATPLLLHVCSDDWNFITRHGKIVKLSRKENNITQLLEGYATTLSRAPPIHFVLWVKLENTDGVGAPTQP